MYRIIGNSTVNLDDNVFTIDFRDDNKTNIIKDDMYITATVDTSQLGKVLFYHRDNNFHEIVKDDECAYLPIKIRDLDDNINEFTLKFYEIEQGGYKDIRIGMFDKNGKARIDSTMDYFGTGLDKYVQSKLREQAEYSEHRKIYTYYFESKSIYVENNSSDTVRDSQKEMMSHIFNESYVDEYGIIHTIEDGKDEVYAYSFEIYGNDWEKVYNKEVGFWLNTPVKTAIEAISPDALQCLKEVYDFAVKQEEKCYEQEMEDR